MNLDGGRVVGAGIVGLYAGELIYIWVLAVTARMNIRAISDMIAPYPTFGYVNKYAADSFRSPVLFGDRVKNIVKFLSHIP